MIADSVDGLLHALRSSELKGKSYLLLPKADATKILQMLEAMKEDLAAAHGRCCHVGVENQCPGCPLAAMESTVRFLEGLR